jgi:hypothetical protein
MARIRQIEQENEVVTRIVRLLEIINGKQLPVVIDIR